MAGRQVHVPEIADVPCTDDDTARIGIVFDGIHSLLYLVYESPFIVRPRTPLIPVNMSQVAVLVRPFVPNPYAVFLQIFHVGIALQEPEQFVDDGPQV